MGFSAKPDDIVTSAQSAARLLQEQLHPGAPVLIVGTDALAKAVRGALKTKWNTPLPGKPRVRVNSVGFFYESPDVGAFLWALSRENDGSFVGMSRP